jgi:hypothetical protein
MDMRDFKRWRIEDYEAALSEVEGTDREREDNSDMYITSLNRVNSWQMSIGSRLAIHSTSTVHVSTAWKWMVRASISIHSMELAVTLSIHPRQGSVEWLGGNGSRGMDW